jgi:hypothetical protein
LSDIIPIDKDLKQRVPLSQLLINFALEYAIRTVLVDLQLNGTLQLPV